MSVIASCGHILTEAEELGKGIATMDFLKDGTRTVCWQTVCDACYKEYHRKGLALPTEKQQNDWMNGVTPYPITD